MVDLQKHNATPLKQEQELELEQEPKRKKRIIKKQKKAPPEFLFDFTCPHCDEPATTTSIMAGMPALCDKCNEMVILHGKKDFSDLKILDNMKRSNICMLICMILFLITQVIAILYFIIELKFNGLPFIITGAVAAVIVLSAFWSFMERINEECWKLLPKWLSDGFSIFERTESWSIAGIPVYEDTSVVQEYNYGRLKEPMLMMLDLSGDSDNKDEEKNFGPSAFCILLAINAAGLAILIGLFCFDIIGMMWFFILYAVLTGLLFWFWKILKDEYESIIALAIIISSMEPIKVIKRKKVGIKEEAKEED